MVSNRSCAATRIGRRTRGGPMRLPWVSWTVDEAPGVQLVRAADAQIADLGRTRCLERERADRALQPGERDRGVGDGEDQPLTRPHPDVGAHATGRLCTAAPEFGRGPRVPARRDRGRTTSVRAVGRSVAAARPDRARTTSAQASPARCSAAAVRPDRATTTSVRRRGRRIVLVPGRAAAEEVGDRGVHLRRRGGRRRGGGRRGCGHRGQPAPAQPRQVRALRREPRVGDH